MPSRLLKVEAFSYFVWLDCFEQADIFVDVCMRLLRAHIFSAVPVPLILFSVRFGSFFQQKTHFQFGSVFSYLLTFLGHFKW